MTTKNEEAVLRAISAGARTWREVAAAAGLSHEGARQIAKRINVEKPAAVPAAKKKKKSSARGRTRRMRASIWDDRVIERFWLYVDREGPQVPGFPELGPCWVWLGPTDGAGYGSHTAFGSRRRSAHRYAWILSRGQPSLPVLDHLCHSLSRTCPGGTSCRHRRCVNPDHLEPVSSRENTARSGARRRRDRVVTCKRGHIWTEDTILYDVHGHRLCRACLERWEDVEIST
ncbi:hypothetical protein FNH13_01015 [Ornithinimicrobium ciconiae]|uniref:HNH endonuclease n=1 Tax=Ornithinimicrobium ciconiae TaxID=2594265 RepID=A0A516G6C3_9MICO|nr:hypothetical protein [Ornithinimicrobium ciconiae]QDO87074.1 hypothetical protein FNH13_01015 [Ornithinimicrobium ciconiae]